MQNTFSATANSSFAGTLAILVIFSSACGIKSKNTNLPKAAGEITVADVDDQNFLRGTQRWNDLLSALKLTNDGTSSSLVTPSEFFANTPEATLAYQQLTAAIEAEHLKTAHRTGCAEVLEFEDIGQAKAFDFSQFKITELSGAKWYLMKYRRKNASGEPDSIINGALVSVPENTGSYPVIAYAHAGDQGLNQIELAGVFGQEQLKYIIVAPAYPGESITAAKSFRAADVSDPYNTDAEDLLASHNCIVEALSVPSALFNMRSKIKRRSTGAYAGTPVSATIGVSRGGMASLIALAKNAALISANRSEAKRFSCAATAINPNTFVYGEFRVFLEAAVRGTAESTSFYSLPTARQLNGLLKEFRDGKEGVTASSTALELQKRDATFNAALFLPTLRNWSTNGKGSLLMMHGTLDKKIPISQGIIGAEIYSTSVQRLVTSGVSPGIFTNTLGFVPQPPFSVDGGVTLTQGSDMHGDFAWFTSLAELNTAKLDPTSLQPTKLTNGEFGQSKTPFTVLSEWLGDTAQGCAATF
jgi:hypothetical protein